jgi:bacterioferritin-associated ferredoxin
MIDLNTKICVCNNLTAQDIVRCIKENNYTELEELLNNETCPMGDKCESCKDEGYNNDGINIPMILSMVKKKQL